MLVFYGTRYFRKIVGHYGPIEVCPNCGNRYQRDYIKEARWAHIYYVPFCPAGSSYHKVCPICYHTVTMKKKEAKAEMAQYPPIEQELVPKVIRHNLSNSYDMFIEDRYTGRRFLLCQNADKKKIKSIKKNRFYKNVEEIQLEN